MTNKIKYFMPQKIAVCVIVITNHTAKNFRSPGGFGRQNPRERLRKSQTYCVSQIQPETAPVKYPIAHDAYIDN